MSRKCNLLPGALRVQHFVRRAVLALAAIGLSIANAFAAPDLSIGPLTVGTPATNSNGSYTFSVSYTVTNAGDGPTQASNYADRVYVSGDATLDAGDWYSEQWRGSTPVAPGESYTVSRSITTGALAPGNYTVFARTDAVENRIVESSETNNTTAGVGITLKRPDLSIGPLTAGMPVTNSNESPRDLWRPVGLSQTSTVVA